MEQDWRLTNQIQYLYQKKLERKQFVPSATRDHDHCAFCWEKFGSSDDMLHEGYCTQNEYHWICECCFEDFKEVFEFDL